ncbi:MAG TPA: hypothetical protein VIA18_00970 [Polyangia bacterium]|jgi:hypothetical protein|nr:hypothetical protein [Polyangia bacterium]
MKNEGMLDEIRAALANDRDEAMRKRRVFRGVASTRPRRAIAASNTDRRAPARTALTMTELTLFLEGSQLVGRYPVSPAAIGDKDLAITIRR